MSARYEVVVEGEVRLNREEGIKKGSPWWRGICILGRLENSDDWFQQGMKRKMGKGNKIRFWEDVWFGGESLKDLFPGLYNVSEDKNKVIMSLGQWHEGRLDWNLSWRRQFFEWEHEQKEQLIDIILPACPQREGKDVWEWTLEGSRSFSSQSTYGWLQQIGQSSDWRGEVDTSIFQQFWKTKAPPKVLAFSWKVLRGRVPTRQNLLRRLVLGMSQDLSCALCEEEMESLNHLFVHCRSVLRVWSKVYQWLGLDVVILPDIVELYLLHKGMFVGRKRRKRGLLVWHNVVWSIWLERNEVILYKSSLMWAGWWI